MNSEIFIFFYFHFTSLDLINLLIHFSDRLDVDECLNHKWLADKADQSEERLQDILAEQTTNVIVTTEAKIVESPDCQKSAECDEETDENDKENSKEAKNVSRHQTSPSFTTKLVLEKSLSLSIFPDAPTTPKVSRKMLYDDEDDLNSQVKEIVKKYQTSESQHNPQKRQSCCNDDIGECVFCHSKKPPSLELDKGIIC